MLHRNRWPLMDGTPGAAGGGEPAPAAPAAAAPAPAPTEPAPSPAPSSLAPAPAAPTEFIPEKFRVMAGDKLDVEASARKLAESYGHLEKRVGSGELPPATADEYKLTVPDEFKDTFGADSERLKAFQTEALAAGLTQKQFDFMLGQYFEIAPTLVDGAMQNSVEAVRGSLEKAWGDKYEGEFTAAVKAFEAFADPADKGKFDAIMTDPALAYRLLAKIGAEIREGGNMPAPATVGEAQDIRALLTSPILQNPKHPEYAATRAKVDAYYNKLAGTEPVR